MCSGTVFWIMHEMMFSVKKTEGQRSGSDIKGLVRLFFLSCQRCEYGGLMLKLYFCFAISFEIATSLISLVLLVHCEQCWQSITNTAKWAILDLHCINLKK